MAAHCEAVGGIGWIFGHLIDGVQAEFARVPYAETSVHLVPEGVSDEQVLFLADILPTGYEIGVQNGRVGPGRHDRRRRRRTGRPGGDDDRGDRRRGPDHRGRHGAVTAQARRELRRDAHGPRRRERRAGDPRAHGGGVDVAMEAVGVPADVRPLHADRARGRHAWPTSASTARRRRCTSRSCGSRTSRSPPASSAATTVPTLLKLARDGRIEAEKLGTHHFALGEIEQAYDVFGAAGEHDALKVVLQAS